MPEQNKQQSNPLADLISSALGIPNAILGPLAERAVHSIRPDGRISITGLLDLGGVTSMKIKEAQAAAKLNELRTKRLEQEINLGVYEEQDAARLEQGRGGLVDALRELGADPRITSVLPKDRLGEVGRAGAGSGLRRGEENIRQEHRGETEDIRHQNRLVEIKAREKASLNVVAANQGGKGVKESPDEKRKKDRREKVFSKALDAELKRKITDPVTGEEKTIPVEVAIKKAKMATKKFMGRGTGKVRPEQFPAMRDAVDRSGEMVKAGIDPELAAIGSIAQTQGTTEALFIPKAQLAGARLINGRELAPAIVRRARQLEAMLAHGIIEGDPMQIFAELLADAGVPVDATGSIADPELAAEVMRLQQEEQ